MRDPEHRSRAMQVNCDVRDEPGWSAQYGSIDPSELNNLHLKRVEMQAINGQVRLGLKAGECSQYLVERLLIGGKQP